MRTSTEAVGRVHRTRRGRREVVSLAVIAGMAGLVALPASAQVVFTVNSTADLVDANVGDGVCDAGGSVCTLRAAIQEANAVVGADTIDLSAIDDPENPILLVIDGVDETWGANPDPATSGAEPWIVVDTHDASIGDLDIIESLTITGAGAAATVIEWSAASRDDLDPDTGDRIFNVVPTDTSISFSMSGVTVRNGSVGLLNSEDPTNPYNIEINPDDTIWQFRRLGGGIALGVGATVVLYDPAIHGGGGGSDDGMGPFPGGPGNEGEEGGSITDATLTDVRVVASYSGGDAGGIYNASPLLLQDSILSGNQSGSNGGGLYNDEASTIRNTTIGALGTGGPLSTGNVAENGGGMFDTGAHQTTIIGSSFVANDATGGGAIAGRSLVVIDILNSTISDNGAFDVGGGITTNGTVTLNNATVAKNTSQSDSGFGGGGLNSFGSGSFVLGNVILDDNVAGTRAANCGCTGGMCNPASRVTSQGNNIEDADTCGFTLLTDLKNTEPLIAVLADNGGLTETHDLTETSPAVDAGSQTICDDVVTRVGADTDQRGQLRTLDGDLDTTAICDVGAVEFVPEPRVALLVAASLLSVAVLRRTRRGGR